MHAFDVRVFNSLEIDEFAFAPKSDFGNFDGGGVDSEVNCFAWSGMVDLELEIVDRDFSIRVNSSVHSEAEDIFDGFVRGFDGELSEERFFLF